MFPNIRRDFYSFFFFFCVPHTRDCVSTRFLHATKAGATPASVDLDCFLSGCPAHRLPYQARVFYLHLSLTTKRTVRPPLLSGWQHPRPCGSPSCTHHHLL